MLPSVPLPCHVQPRVGPHLHLLERVIRAPLTRRDFPPPARRGPRPTRRVLYRRLPPQRHLNTDRPAQTPDRRTTPTTSSRRKPWVTHGHERRSMRCMRRHCFIDHSMLPLDCDPLRENSTQTAIAPSEPSAPEERPSTESPCTEHEISCRRQTQPETTDQTKLPDTLHRLIDQRAPRGSPMDTCPIKVTTSSPASSIARVRSKSAMSCTVEVIASTLNKTDLARRCNERRHHNKDRLTEHRRRIKRHPTQPTPEQQMGSHPRSACRSRYHPRDAVRRNRTWVRSRTIVIPPDKSIQDDISDVDLHYFCAAFRGTFPARVLLFLTVVCFKTPEPRPRSDVASSTSDADLAG